MQNLTMGFEIVIFMNQVYGIMKPNRIFAGQVKIKISMITSIDFHLRPSKRARRSPGSIFVRVIHERCGRSVTLPLRVYPDEWDTVEHRVVFDRDNCARFAALQRVETELEKVRSLLQERVDRFIDEKRAFTAVEVLDVYRRRQGGGSLVRFVKKLSGDMAGLGQERTARGYVTAVRRLVGFTGDRDMQLRQITAFVMRRFEYSLLSEGKALNTVSFYMRNLRAIYNKAVKEGKLEAPAVNPFEDVYTGIQKTRKRALTVEEMNLLQNWKPSIVESGQWTVDSEVPTSHSFGHLSSGRRGNMGTGPAMLPELSVCRHAISGIQKAQQLFLFSFHARGMSFVDMAFLRKEDIRDGVLRYNRKKTGQLLEVNVNKEMCDIMRFFEKVTLGSPYVFPIIHKPGANERLQYESSLRTYNNRLKRLAAQLKVEGGKSKQRSSFGKTKNDTNNLELSIFNFQLSSHVARHSWATIAKRERVPLIVISEGLGHSSEKTTAIYLASFEREVLDRAAEKVSRAIKTTG